MKSQFNYIYILIQIGVKLIMDTYPSLCMHAISHFRLVMLCPREFFFFQLKTQFSSYKISFVE